MSHKTEPSYRRAPLGGMMVLFLCAPVIASEYITTIIDGVSVVEFGDFGKAPNQYPTSVGELNVISSDVVTQANGITLVEKQTNIKSAAEQVPTK